MNNIKHIWSVICKRGLVESNSNVLSLMEILETINISTQNNINFDEKVPLTTPFSAEIISFWRKDNADQVYDGEIRFLILSPKEKELGTSILKFTIPPKSHFIRTVMKMPFLPVVGSGKYKIQVEEKKGTKYLLVAEIPFDVNININDKKDA